MNERKLWVKIDVFWISNDHCFKKDAFNKLFDHRVPGQNGIWIWSYHFLPKNYCEKWSRFLKKLIFPTELVILSKSQWVWKWFSSWNDFKKSISCPLHWSKLVISYLDFILIRYTMVKSLKFYSLFILPVHFVLPWFGAWVRPQDVVVL